MNLTLFSRDAAALNLSADFIRSSQLFSKEQPSPDDVCDLLSHAHHLLNFAQSDEHQNLGLSVICHVAESAPSNPMCRALLEDCISASRNFHYLDMLCRRDGSWADRSGSPLFDFQREFYRAESGTLLTRQQKKLFEVFKRGRRLVVSAPTSFGKTKLLQEIILERPYKRIALVMPTIALISENVSRLRSDPRFNNYLIVNSTTFPLDADRLILVLTPEKLDLLLEEQPELSFDFFSIDEIYKIQDDEERKPVFANVLYNLSRSNADFYLIGPYFKKFSQAFLEKSRASFIHFGIEVVQKEILDLHTISAGDEFELNGNTIVKAKGDETTLKRVINVLKDQQLVYQNTRRGTESLAKKIASWSTQVVQSDLINYVKETVAENWSLVGCLEHGVAFHHGAMPRYIQSHIVDSFNSREIQTLVCTTTLTEGVNTTAKNVVLYSNKKGNDVGLTAFDYKNLKGRAGRFLQHFVGKVIAFHPVVEGERDLISYYYYDSDDVESSAVISIDEKDLTPQAKQKRERVLEVLKNENVPVYVVKANKYIPVEKQIPFVNRLRRDKALLQTLAFQGNLPDKAHLDLIMDLCHEYIFTKRDFESRNFQIGNLKRLVKYYVYQRPSLKDLILTQNGASIDTRVRNAFSLISHFFEFALPKYLICFENLFNFVAQENRTSVINLGFVTTTLQYGFTEPHQIALKDAGVPDGIIEKIGDKLSDCRTSEEIRLRLRINPNILDVLSSFEQKVFRKLI